MADGGERGAVITPGRVKRAGGRTGGRAGGRSWDLHCGGRVNQPTGQAGPRTDQPMTRAELSGSVDSVMTCRHGILQVTGCVLGMDKGSRLDV